MRIVDVYGIRKPMRPSNVGLACSRSVIHLHVELDLYIPNRFARSPRRGADGWKKSRSYCSGLNATVTCRLRDAPFAAKFTPLCSVISWSIFTVSDMVVIDSVSLCGLMLDCRFVIKQFRM